MLHFMINKYSFILVKYYFEVKYLNYIILIVLKANTMSIMNKQPSQLGRGKGSFRVSEFKESTP